MIQPFTPENFLVVVTSDSPANAPALREWNRETNASATLDQWIKDGKVDPEEHDGLLEFAATHKLLSIGAGIFNGICAKYEEDPIALRAQLMRRGADGKTPATQFEEAGQPDLASEIRDISTKATIKLALSDKQQKEYKAKLQNQSFEGRQYLLSRRMAAVMDPEGKNKDGLSSLQDAAKNNHPLDAEIALYGLQEKYQENPQTLVKVLTEPVDGKTPAEVFRQHTATAIADRIDQTVAFASRGKVVIGDFTRDVAEANENRTIVIGG